MIVMKIALVSPYDFAYPGGPPKPPYDAAGWTLAYTMGVDFDSVYDGFDGPFQKIQGFAKPPAGEVCFSTRSGRSDQIKATANAGAHPRASARRGGAAG